MGIDKKFQPDEELADVFEAYSIFIVGKLQV